MPLPNEREYTLPSDVIVSCSSLYTQGWREPESGLEEGGLGQDSLETVWGKFN